MLASCFVRVSGAKGTADMDESHARLLRALAANPRPVVVVSFASPYLLRQFSEVPVYVAAYGAAESSQRAAVGALFGEFPVGGKLPVTLPGLYAYGHGLELPKRAMTLRTPAPAEAGFGREGLAEADRVVEEGVRSGPSPVLCSRWGTEAHSFTFGRSGGSTTGTRPRRPGSTRSTTWPA